MADKEKETMENEEEKKPVFVEAPVFDIEYKGECAYEVKVTIPVANEKKQAEELFDELKHEAEVPGFRRGRAPRALVEKKFGKAVKGEVVNKLVSAAFEKLIEDEKFRVMGAPDADGRRRRDRPRRAIAPRRRTWRTRRPLRLPRVRSGGGGWRRRGRRARW